MPIPDFQTIMLPLLEFLSDKKEHSLREAIEFLAEKFKLTDSIFSLINLIFSTGQISPTGTSYKAETIPFTLGICFIYCNGIGSSVPNHLNVISIKIHTFF